MDSHNLGMGNRSPVKGSPGTDNLGMGNPSPGTGSLGTGSPVTVSPGTGNQVRVGMGANRLAMAEDLADRVDPAGRDGALVDRMAAHRLRETSAPWPS